MTTIGTHIIKLVEDTGRTIFLLLSTAEPAKFSLTGTSWFPLSQATSQGEDPVKYVGGTGIQVVGNVISEKWVDYRK